jgi:hypothetical protein
MDCRSRRELWAFPVSGVVLLAIALTITGCRRYDVRVYDAPKEKAVARAELPAGWEQASAGSMQLSRYIVRGAKGEEAQVSVVPLPGSSGSELANVNRWRNQLGLPAITEEELNHQVEEVMIAGEPGRMFEMSGKGAEDAPTRTLAAVLKHAGTTWFFKMMGDDDLVRSQKEAFVGFITKYEIAHDDHSHASGPLASARPAQPPPPSVPGTNWVIPKSWQQVTPGPMQDAKFVVGGGAAVVSLSKLGGSGGALLPNINRWRTQQLQLPAATEKDLETLAVPLDLPEGKATLVDMTGPSQRLVAAVIPRGEMTWYFKLMGEDATVGAEKAAFLEFVKSIK